MYGLGISGQDSFGGGIFRGRNAPADSVYDAINALVNDERDLFKRGGDALLTTADLAAVGLAVKNTIAGQRVMQWSSAAFAVGAGASVVATGGGSTVMPPAGARPATTVDAVVLPSQPVNNLNSMQALVYAGSLKPHWSPLAISATNGAKVVAIPNGGALTNVDVGAIVTYFDTGTPRWHGIVASVDSDVQVTLTQPWAGPTGGADIRFDPVVWIDLVQFTPPGVATAPQGFVAAAGTRLLYAVRNRVGFTAPNVPWVDDGSNATSFHELPVGDPIVGIEGLGSTAVVFTTSGVWAIANLDLDPFDAQGNIQHTVAQINQDAILWGDAGIASMSGSLLVPAIDDVFLFSLSGAPVPISASIRPMYRGYVKAGYKPGTGAVHRGHYFLPILDPANAVVDALVCRLDLRDSRGNLTPAWTRLGGHAAGAAFATQVGSSARQPKLLAATGQRISDLSDVFTVPGAGTDGDGTAPVFTVVTQDYGTGGGPKGQTVRKVRVDYELAGAAGVKISASVARGSEGSAFSALTDPGDAGPSDGTAPATWRVNAKAPTVRFRLVSAGQVTKLIVRGVKLHVRPSGKA